MTYSVTHMLGARRNGLNRVQMNMGTFDRNSGPVQGTNYPVFLDKLFDWYKANGVKSIRFLLTWEAIQSTLGGAVPSTAAPGYIDYWTDLANVLNRLLARDIYVTVGLWQYNKNSQNTDIVYDSAAFSATNFADYWRQVCYRHQRRYQQRSASGI
jgi:aryl-phospho-beta-D-glucosidase BglC (GH1 family)